MEVDILTIQFSTDKIVNSEEIYENVIIDYNENGQIVAIEMLDISKYQNFQDFLSEIQKILK